MKYSTLGHNFYVGTEVPIKYISNQHCETNVKDRLRYILIKTGTGIITMDNATSTRFIAPCLICINENETISIDTNQNIEIVELIFHPACINPLFDYKYICDKPLKFTEDNHHEAVWLNVFSARNEQHKGVLNIGIAASNRIEHLMLQINQELIDQRDWYWPCRTISFLLELLLIVDRVYRELYAQSTYVVKYADDEVYQLILYLNSNYKEKIQLSTLTEKFNMNRTTLNETFKKATGVPIITYLIMIRIQLSMALLKDTALQVSEIMERVGFINSAHFIRAFKKHTGLLPTEYRDIHTWLYK